VSRLDCAIWLARRSAKARGSSGKALPTAWLVVGQVMFAWTQVLFLSKWSLRDWRASCE